MSVKSEWKAWLSFVVSPWSKFPNM